MPVLSRARPSGPHDAAETAEFGRTMRPMTAAVRRTMRPRRPRAENGSSPAAQRPIRGGRVHRHGTDRHPQSRDPADEPARGAGRATCWPSSSRSRSRRFRSRSPRSTGVTGEEQETVIQDFANANPTALIGRVRRAWTWPRAWSSRPWARAPAPRWRTSASRSRPCPSASCRRSTARTC